MTAAHVHRTGCGTTGKKEEACRSRVKYMSYSRSDKLHQRQMGLLRSEFPDVLIVDLYDLTFNGAHYAKPGDGRHYNAEMCRKMWHLAFGD